MATPFMQELITAGGLVEYTKQYLKRQEQVR